MAKKNDITRDYGQLLYLNPKKTYAQASNTVYNFQVYSNNVSAHSEFQKPYNNTSYVEMDNTWDGSTLDYNFSYPQFNMPNFNLFGPLPAMPSPGPGGGGGDKTPHPPAPNGCSMYHDGHASLNPGSTVLGGFGFGGFGGSGDSWNNADTDPIIKCATIAGSHGTVVRWDQYSWEVKIADDAHPYDVIEVQATTRSGKTCSDTFRVAGGFCNCTPAKIAYSSQQMAANESQLLVVYPIDASCNYGWAVGAGGGSLSTDTGTSTIYTAPESNANCTNNPTVNLTCKGDVIDTLKIAINAYTGGGYAVKKGHDAVTYQCNPSTPCSEAHPGWCESEYCGFLITFYACDMSVITDSGEAVWTEGCLGEAGYCLDNNSIWGNTYRAWGQIAEDMRTDYFKEQGCCPAALL
jgi:hypothetical protein